VDTFQAIVLGVVQGLTEFLPISSSGHLELVPRAFGWSRPEGSAAQAFDVALHFGTLLAVIAHFWSDLVRYIVDGVRAVARPREASSDGRLAWMFVVSAIPASIAGVLLNSWIDDRLGTPAVIGWSLIGFGALLYVADHAAGSRALTSVSLKDATAIGFAQVLALNPGTSRSGITISAGRFLGLQRDAAVRFSFVMGIPVIFGAFVFEMAQLVSDGVPDGLVSAMVAGGITAFISGWLAVAGLLRFVQTRSFTPFVVYRIILGVVVLVFAYA
jgi:undecaprenyl-diphosphatase